MSLKSMHNESRQENRPTEPDNSLLMLVEEQSQTIADLQNEIADLQNRLAEQKQESSLIISELKSEVQKLADKNEMLNGADEVLKQNAELEKQNQSLQKQRQEALKEAEAREYHASRREQEANKREREARELIENQDRYVKATAVSMMGNFKIQQEQATAYKRAQLEAEYNKANKNLEAGYKAKSGSFCFILLITIVGAVFHAIGTEYFVSDFTGFFKAIGILISQLWNLAVNGANTASQLGDKIPQEVVSVIVHYLLLILVFVIIFGGVVGAILFGLYKLGKFYKEEFWDRASLWVVAVSLLFIAYFGDYVRNFLPINLILFVILIHGIYLIIRMATSRRGY